MRLLAAGRVQPPSLAPLNKEELRMNTCVLCKRQRDDDHLVPFADLLRCRDLDSLSCAAEQERARREQWEQGRLLAEQQAAAESAQRRVGGTCSLCGRTYRDGFAADGRLRDSGLVPLGNGALRCANVAGCAAERERSRHREHERAVEERTGAAFRARQQEPAERLRLRRGGGLGW